MGVDDLIVVDDLCERRGPHGGRRSHSGRWPI